MNLGKKIIFVIMTVFVYGMITNLAVNAAFSDVPPNAPYMESLDRVAKAGIINGDENGLFRPNKYITREQFIKIIVKAVGYNISNKTDTYFRDVDIERWSRPFINTAFENKMVAGRGDRLFYPESEVKVSEAATIAVRALGFNEDRSTLRWPQNYILKATDLGFMENITDGAEDKLTRWAAAIMIDKLFTYVLNDSEYYNGDLTSLYTDIVVYEDRQTWDKLDSEQYITNLGTVDVLSGDVLEIGSKYRTAVYGNDIVRVDKKNKFN
jgi:hypothetical protein